jgi:uncharacterized protein with HEPN domain
MRRDPRALLADALSSADAIHRFLTDRQLQDYVEDEMLRSAVERQFEIFGEALAQLRKTDPALARRVQDAEKAIGLRNVLIHGYAKVDHQIVWEAATRHLPTIRVTIESVLRTL